MGNIKARETANSTDTPYITCTDLGLGKTGLDVAATYVPAVVNLVDYVIGFSPLATLIPRSSANAILLTTVGADATVIQSIEDIGEFMALYADAARATLICVLPLAGGIVEVGVPSGTALYIGAIKDADIVSDTLLNINFLG